jgi:ubiquitin-like-conjugating enzyme ATG10
MTRRDARSSDFKNYPFLTGEEFAEVCHYLDRRYCQATLGPLRRQWKLRVCSALNTVFSLGPEYSTFLQIIRPLDQGGVDDDELARYMDSLSFDSTSGGPKLDRVALDAETDTKMREAEEADLDQVRI